MPYEPKYEYDPRSITLIDAFELLQDNGVAVPVVGFALCREYRLTMDGRRMSCDEPYHVILPLIEMNGRLVTVQGCGASGVLRRVEPQADLPSP